LNCVSPHVGLAEKLADKADPKELYLKQEKIGEGSTGSVYRAKRNIVSDTAQVSHFSLPYLLTNE